MTTTSTVLYPAPAFSFSVSVAGSSGAAQGTTQSDASFQEVSGLDARIDVEELQEGGENRYVHRLPKPTRASNLVLKRGFVTGASYLATWAGQTVGSTYAAPITTNTIVVMLLGTDRSPLAAWNFERAWPVRWVTGPFDSMKNDVLTEVLEFSYSTVTRIAVP
ncbi:phage tail-like protein [Azospirillum fermentarium]|uniref:phage tail protein n=1 Tax=Azospirillum fermentarium TaxID=1233114 RepID=UPI0022266239|nr:phage tail protein [Azospirillum fermentarium]MCW2247939.1 phage tail-like protein [Azospirillum fermentarium]